MKSKKYILVVGGAGYIGSHTVKLLISKGFEVIILDSLEYGHEEAIDKRAKFILGDLGNKWRLEEIFQNYEIEAVFHFAAYINVGESVSDPAKYYQNNVAAPLNLLDVMMKYNCKKFIFSSTCATYGNPLYSPLDENHPQNPINAYGQSKLMLEKIILDYNRAYSLQYAFLRYFNASGAIDDATIGEDHYPETHLIPLILQAAKGERSHITVFGNDYDTPDGTCIRDYIHVLDLGEAHIKALEFIENNQQSIAVNLGTGKGYSVQEVITIAEMVTGLTIPVVIGERREGDPAKLVANPIKAKEVLGWEARYNKLEDIVASAWKWHNAYHNGKFENFKNKTVSI